LAQDQPRVLISNILIHKISTWRIVLPQDGELWTVANRMTRLRVEVDPWPWAVTARAGLPVPGNFAFRFGPPRQHVSGVELLLPCFFYARVSSPARNWNSWCQWDSDKV
jgi:hypothetical protein